MCAARMVQKGPTWWAPAGRLAKKAPGVWKHPRGRPPPAAPPRRLPTQFRASVLNGDGQDEFELRDLAAERRADADQYL